MFSKRGLTPLIRLVAIAADFEASKLRCDCFRTVDGIVTDLSTDRAFPGWCDLGKPGVLTHPHLPIVFQVLKMFLTVPFRHGPIRALGKRLVTPDT